MADADVHGPIDYVLLEFPGDEPRGKAGEALLDLVERGLVRVYDLLLIHKDEDGKISGVEFNDLSDKGLGGFTAFSGARSGLLGDEDLREAAAAMNPGTASVLIASARIPAPDVMRALEALEATS